MTTTEVLTNIVSEAKAYDLVGAYDYVTVHNLTTGKIYKWVKGLPAGKALQPGGALIAADGFTPFKEKTCPIGTKAKITAVTKGNPTIVTLDDAKGFTANQIVRVSLQSTFKMVELNGKQTKILSVDATAKTITVDLDSTNFTDFATSDKGSAIVSVVGIAPTCNGICGVSSVKIGCSTYGLTLGTAIIGAANDVIVVTGGIAVEGCGCG
jgi:hypothetical protein